MAAGFTLIELLVVIGIIGLLATIAVAAFGGAQDRAKDTKRIADMRGIVSAFAAAVQDDPSADLCTGAGTPCSAGWTVVTAATPVKLNTVHLCSAGCTTGQDITKNYINLTNMKDPTNNPAASACNSAAVATCEYSVTSTTGDPSDFNAFFWTKGPVQGTAAGAHTASQIGIIK